MCPRWHAVHELGMHASWDWEVTCSGRAATFLALWPTFIMLCMVYVQILLICAFLAFILLLVLLVVVGNGAIARVGT